MVKGKFGQASKILKDQDCRIYSEKVIIKTNSKFVGIVSYIGIYSF